MFSENQLESARLEIGLVSARQAKRSEADLNPCQQALDECPVTQPGAYLHGVSSTAGNGTAGSGERVTLIGDGPQQPGQCSVTGTDWAACRN